MHRLTLITIASSSVAFISLAFNSVLLASSKRLRRRLETFEYRLEEELTSLSQDLDTASKQAGENARRIAWLESRARSNRVEPKPAVEPVVPNNKTTITEKRHRVLSLARRGQDVQSIARTLGMNYGEVELMISLGRAA